MPKITTYKKRSEPSWRRPRVVVGRDPEDGEVMQLLIFPPNLIEQSLIVDFTGRLVAQYVGDKAEGILPDGPIPKNLVEYADLFSETLMKSIAGLTVLQEIAHRRVAAASDEELAKWKLLAEKGEETVVDKGAQMLYPIYDADELLEAACTREVMFTEIVTGMPIAMSKQEDESGNAQEEGGGSS